jgi:hypothetical protein
VKLAAAVFLAALVTAGAAFAMGADPWTNAQTGLTYPLYKPTFTAGLKQGKLSLLDCASNDAWVAVSYGAGGAFGGKKRGIDLLEGNPICSDIGDARLITTRTIGGAKVKIFVGCEPTKPCKLAYGKTMGYVLAWKHLAPATGAFKGKATQLEIVGQHLSLAEVLKVAGSLRPLQ